MSDDIMKQKWALYKLLGGNAMKEKYAEPMILIMSLQQEDIITASPSNGDNMIEDGFFD